MKKTIKISIPEPCHEDWAKMTPTEKGKFCSVCTKEVFDFTQTTDEELVKRVMQGKSLCGRFKASQLNREMTLERKSKTSLLPYAASLLMPLSVLATSEVKSHPSPLEKNYVSLGIGSNPSKKSEINLSEKKEDSTKLKIKGTIIDENNLPLPGTTIIIKGTSIGTQTDFDGKYSIEANAHQTLIFTYIGYSSKEVVISNIANTIDITMEPSNDIMGEIVFVGGISYDEKVVVDPYQSDSYYDEEQQAKSEERRAYAKKVNAFQKIKAERKKAERQLKRSQKKKN
ncbi:MAG: carboxypeptidase-like regulatory domain-containing protein [Flavobacteriaceae bacterium]